MGEYYRFENLTTWHHTRQFLKVIYRVSRDFPNEERYCLTSQIRRAALSVMLNVAEGSARGSDKDFVRFLRIAYTSLLEVVSCCYAAKDQQYMSDARFTFVYEQSHTIAKKINALIRYLEKKG